MTDQSKQSKQPEPPSPAPSLADAVCAEVKRLFALPGAEISVPECLSRIRALIEAREEEDAKRVEWVRHVDTALAEVHGGTLNVLGMGRIAALASMVENFKALSAERERMVAEMEEMKETHGSRLHGNMHATIDACVLIAKGGGA